MIFWTLALLMLVASVLPARAESVRSFESSVRLKPGGEMSVEETVDVDFTGSHRLAVYRIIPASLSVNGHRHDYDVKVHKVTDGHGHNIPFSKSRQSGSVIVRIEDGRLEREHHAVYTLSYEARGVCNFYKMHPQLYWEVTGKDFPLPVKHAQVVVYLPRGVSLERTDVRAWVGSPSVAPEDASRQSPVSVKKDHVLATASDLPAGKSLNIEVDLPSGVINEPGLVDRARWLLSDWYLLLVLPLVVVALLFVYHWCRVNIPRKSGDTVELWQPPEAMAPVEIGTLLDQSCDISDLSGTLIDLSVRGYYTIREIPATGFFALSDKDYEFKKLAPPLTDSLKDHEELFMEALFGASSTSYLSNVQGVFRQYIPRLQDAIYGRLVAEGLLVKNPRVDRVRFMGIGVALSAFGVALLLLFGEEPEVKAAGLGLIISGALVAVAPSFVPVRTEKGKKAIDSIHQFQETLRTAQEHGVAGVLEGDKFMFHRLLPYAIVLGVFDKWSVACEPSIERWPDWFQFHRTDSSRGPFSATAFARDVCIATKIAELTFSAPPPRQYSSSTVGPYGARREQEHHRRDS